MKVTFTMWARQVHWYGWRALSSRSVSHVHSTWTCSVYQRWKSNAFRRARIHILSRLGLPPWHWAPTDRPLSSLQSDPCCSWRRSCTASPCRFHCCLCRSLACSKKDRHYSTTRLRYLSEEYTHGEREDRSHHVSLVVTPQTGEHLLENRNQFADESGPHADHRLLDQVVDLRVILVLHKAMTLALAEVRWKYVFDMQKRFWQTFDNVWTICISDPERHLRWGWSTHYIFAPMATRRLLV